MENCHVPFEGVIIKHGIIETDSRKAKEKGMCFFECPCYHGGPQVEPKSRGCAYAHLFYYHEYIEHRSPGLTMCNHPDLFQNRNLIEKIFDIVSR